MAATTPLPNPLPGALPTAEKAAADYREMEAASNDQLARVMLENNGIELGPPFRDEFVRSMRLVFQEYAYRAGGAPPISEEDRAWYWRWRCHPDTQARFRQLRQTKP